MEQRIVDRSTWGKGQWDNEPDRVDFVVSGYACFTLRGPAGAWCGYVGVPNNHPAYEKDYSDIDVDVHGGITYAEKCAGAICHIPQPGMPDDVWWLGFDTAHFGDVTPLQRIGDVMLGSRVVGHGESYKTIGYVIAEVTRLAKQLKEIEDAK